MNRSNELTPIPLPEQEPAPGSLGLVERRLEGALTINLSTMADTTDRVSERDKDKANRTFVGLLWQQSMIQNLRNQRLHEALNDGATWSNAEEQASRLSASEALTHLEDWVQQNLGAPRHGEDPNDAIYRGYAEDLQSKLIDEASRGLA